MCLGEDKMLDQVQFIKENDHDRFAIIPIDEYRFLKELLDDEEKLADYLDYLHQKRVKVESNKRLSLAEIKYELSLE